MVIACIYYYYFVSLQCDKEVKSTYCKRYIIDNLKHTVMKIYEFRSELTSYPEGASIVETELFLSKAQAVQYMRAKAIEYENANIRENFYWAIDSDPEGAEEIELNSSCNSDVFGLFSINEREVNECLLEATI